MTDTGAHTHVNLLWEDNGFASAPNDSDHKNPGHNTQLRTAEGNNQVREVLQPGTKVPVDLIENTFDGQWSMEFTLADPWWMRAVFGAPTQTDNGDGSYTYTYDGTTPDSMRIIEGYVNSGDERVVKGAVTTQVQVRCAVDDDATITLRGPYAREEKKTPASLTAQAAPDHRAMTYAQGELQLAGATKKLVQDVTLTVPLNAQLVNELGTRFGVDFFTASRVPEVEVNEFKDAGGTDSLTDFYGGAATQQETMENESSMTLTFTNGKAAGSGINEMIYNITGSLTDRYSEDGIGDPERPLSERATRMAQDIDATATNEIATAP